jgi:hypothetical protein
MSEFLDLVQLHERAWGVERYPQRPSLQQIMESPFVTFWSPVKQDRKERMTIRLYDSIGQIEEYFVRLIFRSAVHLPETRLMRIYFQQKRYVVSGVRLKFEEAQLRER